MTILECENCGGTHYRSYVCPYISAPCVICGDATIYACSDCAINAGGRGSVHVCRKSSCQDQHEATTHPCEPRK